MDREDPETLSRRRFLGLAGAYAAFGAAACSKPDRGLIVPHAKEPAGAVPGVADHYATTFQEGFSACGVLVKTREGRPIHIAGNDKHPLSMGKTTPRAIADILGLYDPERLTKPRIKGHETGRKTADAKALGVLRGARKSGKKLLLLTAPLLSPSRRALVADLGRALPLHHVSWEPAGGSFSGALRLDRAGLIVSFEDDFLSGDRPSELAEFAAWRRPQGLKGRMNRLYVFEGGMSLTGAKADHRFALRPSRASSVAFALARLLHEAGLRLPSGMRASTLEGFPVDKVAAAEGLPAEFLRRLAADMRSSGRDAVITAGSGMPPELRTAVRLLNRMLGAEGWTSTPSAMAEDGATDLAGVRNALQAAAEGGYAGALFWGNNPAYDFPDAALWKAAAAALPFKLRISLYGDETSQVCDVVFPESHWLESWGDFESVSGLLSLRQPAVSPLYGTLQAEDIILGFIRALGGSTAEDYRRYLRKRWNSKVYRPGPVSFERFWAAALHDGLVDLRPPSPPASSWDAGDVAAAVRSAGPDARKEGFELFLKPGLAVYDGRYSNNGWLQELPDPVTKQTWGNAVSISADDAGRLGLKDGDEVALEAGGAFAALPLVVQPGQAEGVLTASLGYGRGSGSVGSAIGANLFPFLDPESGTPCLRTGVRLSGTGRRAEVVRTQDHHSMEGRDIARSLTADEYAAGLAEHGRHHELHSLLPEREPGENKWGLAVDLSACVGCGACVMACQSENNIPSVGPEQVSKGREMHWLRVDRYYEGDPEAPEVRQMPMLCQHCDDAPCETVCPVNATNHSPDGLNQMVYNRCVGTRYCANNCPYKVRRFNFFEYLAKKEAPEALVFNPEVSVRPRGVMEKCTFCVQRIQEARMKAKAEGRELEDGDIVTACEAACPAHAMVFGDLRDVSSRTSRISRDSRGYRVLEELGAKPNITYLADLRNPVSGAPVEEKKEGHGR